MRLAYLCNLYPAVSHSFIRREIEGVEAAGLDIHRFSLRPAAANLKDHADLRESPLTEAVLGQGLVRLFAAWLALMLTHPGRSLRAVFVAYQLSAPGLKSKIRHLAYMIEAAWLTRRFHYLRIKHVHAHFGTNPAAVCVLVRALGGPPFSFTVHGPDEFDAREAVCLRIKIEAACFVVAISSYGRSQLMRWCKPDNWNKIHVIRCGLDAGFLYADAPPVSGDTTEFVCVSRLSSQKGLPLLMEACDQLQNQGKRFSLTIIGDGELRAEIEHEIYRHGLDGIVRLAGVQSSDEIRSHLRRARAMVLPSFAEGLPVVLMEALALGRPVITTAIAGIPELVDSCCGWVVPAGSKEALVSAMQAVLDAPAEQLTAMGLVGRERARAMHNAKRNAAELAEIIVEHAG
jgi:glycosyltransferase involved in cell wall biosynthesis